MTVSTLEGIDLPADLPPVPYLVGLGQHKRHAVPHDTASRDREAADTSPTYVIACCGSRVTLALKFGEFRRGNQWLSSNSPDRTCATCSWEVAISLGAVAAELQSLTPAGCELEALSRHLDDPLALVHVCEAILRIEGVPTDPNDDPLTVQLLSHATVHAPVVLMSEECADGNCEHCPEDRIADRAWECGLPDGAVRVACAACSVRAGSWAGEWEGQFTTQGTVAAPCGVLTQLASHYGVVIDGRRRIGGLA